MKFCSGFVLLIGGSYINIVLDERYRYNKIYKNNYGKPMSNKWIFSTKRSREKYKDKIAKLKEVNLEIIKKIEDYHITQGKDEARIKAWNFHKKEYFKNGNLIWEYYIGYFGGIKGLKEYLNIK